MAVYATSFLCVLKIQRIKQQTSPLEQFAAISKTVWLTSLSAISCVSCKQVTTNICCCASFCGPVPARHTKSFPLFRNHYFNITGLLLCCKNFFLNFVLLCGPLFAGAPVRPSMLNMPKSASVYINEQQRSHFIHGKN